jgi:hypothetical protein
VPRDPPEQRSGEVVDGLTRPAIGSLAGRETPTLHADRGWMGMARCRCEGMPAPYSLAMFARSIDDRCASARRAAFLPVRRSLFHAVREAVPDAIEPKSPMEARARLGEEAMELVAPQTAPKIVGPDVCAAKSPPANLVRRTSPCPLNQHATTPSSLPTKRRSFLLTSWAAPPVPPCKCLKLQPGGHPGKPVPGLCLWVCRRRTSVRQPSMRP